MVSFVMSVLEPDYKNKVIMEVSLYLLFRYREIYNDFKW